MVGYGRPGPPPSPLFRWCVFHARYSVFQLVRLQQNSGIPVQAESFPVTQGWEVTRLPQWGFPVQIPVPHPCPRCGGACCPQQQSTLILSGSQDIDRVLQLP